MKGLLHGLLFFFSFLAWTNAFKLPPFDSSEYRHLYVLLDIYTAWVSRQRCIWYIGSLGPNTLLIYDAEKLKSIGDGIHIPPDVDPLRSLGDLGNSLKGLGEKGFEFMDTKWKAEAAKIPGALEKIDEFKDAVEKLVKEVEGFARRKSRVFEESGIDLEVLIEAIRVEFEYVVEELKAEFSEPLPEDQDEWYKEFEKSLDRTLNRIEDALVSALAICGNVVPEFEVRANFRAFRPHIKKAILIAGKSHLFIDFERIQFFGVSQHTFATDTRWWPICLLPLGLRSSFLRSSLPPYQLCSVSLALGHKVSSKVRNTKFTRVISL